MKFWYLDHSAVAVQTDRHLLLFDLFGDVLNPQEGEGLDQGKVLPQQIAQEDVLIFVSHEHQDHFDQKVFALDSLPRVRFVLPEELDVLYEKGIFGANNQTITLADATITTFESTDIGLGYLVEIDGKLIYHAGDLNWWHWQGEEDEFNLDQEKRYLQQMQYLKKAVGDRVIDLAFVPVDPRLEEDCLRGICAFSQAVKADKIVPIHFWGDFSVCQKVKQAPQAAAFADHVVTLHRCGESFIL